MTRRIRLPGGKELEFPDDATDEDIQKALASHASNRVGQFKIAGLSVAAVGILVLSFVAVPRPKQPRAVQVALQIAPSGAEITIDGRLVQDTVISLSLGSHTIRVRSPGYQDSAQAIDVRPDRRVIALQLTPMAPEPAPIASVPPADVGFGSVDVSTPNVDGVSVLVAGRQKGKTQNGQFFIDSLEPGEQSISARKSGYCVDGLSTQKVFLNPGERKAAQFVLRPVPRFRVDSAPENAELRIDESFRRYVPRQEIDVSPGAHRIVVSADGFQGFVRDLNLKCGDTTTIVAKLAAAATKVVAPESTVATQESKEPAGAFPTCPVNSDDWTAATSDCFYADRGGRRAYEFELTASSQRIASRLFLSTRLQFGPWVLGTPTNHVECMIDDESLKWRPNDKADWRTAGKLRLPKDRKTIFVRVHFESGNAVFEIGADAADAQRQDVSVAVPDEGFGLKTGTKIRGLKQIR